MPLRLLETEKPPPHDASYYRRIKEQITAEYLGDLTNGPEGLHDLAEKLAGLQLRIEVLEADRDARADAQCSSVDACLAQLDERRGQAPALLRLRGRLDRLDQIIGEIAGAVAELRRGRP